MGTVRWHHRGISVTFPMFRPHRRNAELLGDLRRPHAFSFRLLHLSRIDRNRAPLVDAEAALGRLIAVRDPPTIRAGAVAAPRDSDDTASWVCGRGGLPEAFVRPIKPNEKENTPYKKSMHPRLVRRIDFDFMK